MPNKFVSDASLKNLRFKFIADLCEEATHESNEAMWSMMARLDWMTD